MTIQTVLALAIVAGAAVWLVLGTLRKWFGAARAACGACSTGSQDTCARCPGAVERERPGRRGLLQIADR